MRVWVKGKLTGLISKEKKETVFKKNSIRRLLKNMFVYKKISVELMVK